MVTFLYLVRHCQSVGNVQNRFQGRVDSPASPLGRQQLDLLSLRFRNIPLDAVYSSPLVRAYETAEAVNRFHGLPIRRREDLMEVDVGDAEDLPFTELAVRYPQIIRDWKEAKDRLSFPGGETMADAYRRMSRALEEILAECAGKRAAVVTHGAMLFCLNALVRYGSLEAGGQGEVFDNTSVSLLKAEDGKLSWEFVNDISHLPEGLGAPYDIALHPGDPS